MGLDDNGNKYRRCYFVAEVKLRSSLDSQYRHQFCIDFHRRGIFNNSCATNESERERDKWNTLLKEAVDKCNQHSLAGLNFYLVTRHSYDIIVLIRQSRMLT